MTEIPPGPRWRWPGEMLVRSRRDPLGFLQMMSRRYGDLSSFRIGPQLIVIVNDPDLIKDVLVTNQRLFRKGHGTDRMKPLLGEGLLTTHGETHRRLRRFAQPAFHRERVATYASVMVEHAERYQSRLRDGVELDLAEEMMALTLGIVGATLFGANVGGEAEEIRGGWLGGALGGGVCRAQLP